MHNCGYFYSKNYNLSCICSDSSRNGKQLHQLDSSWLQHCNSGWVVDLMPLNNVISVGDDQRWKQEVESVINDLKNRIIVLEAQVNSRGV